jgi:hypothetical protein
VIKSRRKRWAGHVARIGDKMNVHRMPEGKGPLGRSRHGWVNNIKIGLREIGLGGVDWIDLAEDRH